MNSLILRAAARRAAPVFFRLGRSRRPTIKAHGDGLSLPARPVRLLALAPAHRLRGRLRDNPAAWQFAPCRRHAHILSVAIRHGGASPVPSPRTGSHTPTSSIQVAAGCEDTDFLERFQAVDGIDQALGDADAAASPNPGSGGTWRDAGLASADAPDCGMVSQRHDNFVPF